jgi:hypothetical protein
MPFSDCKVGKWYVVLTCGSCGVRQPLYPDPSEGKSEIKSAIVRCPVCQRNRFYQATAFERYKHVKPDTDDIGDFLAQRL